MLATGGSRAREPRRGARALRIGTALAAVAAIIALASGPAAAGIPVQTPNPTAAVADGVRLAVIVPITAPADTVGLIPSDALATLTAPTGLLTAQLDAVEGAGVILAIDPMILASIRVLGTAAPASAKAWLARLEAEPNERFALPYADADPTLFTQSSAGGVLAPTGFAFAINPENFAEPAATVAPTATPLPTADPTPASDPDALTAVPTDAEVIAVPGAVPGVAWPRVGTVAEADLAALGTTTLLLAAADVDGAVSGIATIDGIRALVIDPAVSAAVQAAATAADEITWTTAATAATAALVDSVSGQTTTSPTVVVALDRLAAATAPRLAATLAAITADPAIALVGLAALDAGEAAEATLVPGAQDAQRIAVIDARLAIEHRIDAFATVVERPSSITEPTRLTTLALAGQGWVGRSDWAGVVTETDAAAEALLASVHVIESSFLFVADRSSLPVAIQNDGSQSVTVLVTADPRTGLLDIDPAPVELVVPAGSQATAEFAATAVSNGAVTVTVSMTSPVGVPIGAPAVADVNVQAGWETPVIAAAAIAVGVLFVFGVVRTVRRIMKSRRGDVAGETTDTDG